MPGKGRYFPPLCVKNARNPPRIPALFALIGGKHRLFQVLRSFEVAIFSINK